MYWLKNFRVSRREHKYLQYSAIKNPLQIYFKESTSIELCSESEMPGSSRVAPSDIIYQPISLVKKSGGKSNAFVNVRGIVLSLGMVETHMTVQSHRHTKKQSITIMDKSEETIDVILWGTEVNKITSKLSVISVQHGKVYAGKSGNLIHVWFSSRLFLLDQSSEESKQLINWYHQSFLSVLRNSDDL